MLQLISVNTGLIDFSDKGPHMLKKSIFLVLLLAISGCGPIYKTDYTMVPPRNEAGRQCANNCLLAQQNCRQNCTLTAHQCEQNGQLQAQNNYLQYVNERQRTGKPIKKTPSDFSSYNDCESDECQELCANDYRICHTNCGGQVIPRTYCVSGCQ